MIPRWMFVLFVALMLAWIVLLALPYLVRAEGPQPWQYAMVKCSGLGIDDIVYGEAQFDTDYGWAHQITTMDEWRATFPSRVNEFANSLGCAHVFRDLDGYGPSHLTQFYRIYDATYQRIIERNLTR